MSKSEFDIPDLLTHTTATEIASRMPEPMTPYLIDCEWFVKTHNRVFTIRTFYDADGAFPYFTFCGNIENT